MSEIKTYSARTVFEGMKRKLQQYLEAQYHIWDESLIADRARLLEKEGGIFQEPRLEATPFYVPGKSYGELRVAEAAKKLLNIACAHKITGIPEKPYQHQAESLETFLGNDREIIVATGTGSGKTESFLMPILGAMAIEADSRPQSWLQPGCRALLLYPMNALVNDQISRLRRILRQEEVARQLQGARNHRATFGMYTSRTPYPGEEDVKKNEIRLGSFIKKAFIDLPPEAEERLKKEGKWPAKDLKQYLSSSFETGPTDAEMLSRQEMQDRCPDLLVTNYSMLEYMMLRPIEAPIFDQTAAWLACDTRNKFIVVLDEAHMYRGSGGAEVAYLLRRLHARLGISRDRARYILTSASLGASPEAKSRMKSFASDLSGHEHTSKEFVLITGERQRKAGERSATQSDAAALAGYDFSTLHEGENKLSEAISEFKRMSATLGYTCPNGISDILSFQNAVYGWLQSFGPAAFVANKITSEPQQLREIAALTFPNTDLAAAALEGLLALMSFAKERDTDSVFSPVRSHLFFRGLPGIYACINPNCKVRESSKLGILGKLYSTPRLTCDCGTRVYEVLTHRDCGAAFIRGYVHDAHGNFLWHQPSAGLWGLSGLLEAHFLVEVSRRAQDGSGRYEGSSNWLHKTTGQLSMRRPEHAKLNQYVEVIRPDGLMQIAGQPTLTFNNQCPVCTTNWRAGSTKIMDLATKGEAPFAQLVRSQVELQPQTIQPSDRSPNGGRKSLLFSDGRQKAARLARDIPREIENDVFRQLLLLGVKELLAVNQEPRLSRTYVAVVHALAQHSLLLFDGNDKDHLQQDVRNYLRYYEGNLGGALQDQHPPPPSFNSLLLRHLGSPFYSLSALTLAHLTVPEIAYRAIVRRCPDIGKADLDRLLLAWIQSFANAFAIDSNLAHGIRVKAAGHQLSGGSDATAVFSRQTQRFLRERVPTIDKVFQVFAEVLCHANAGHGGQFIDPNKLSLTLATEDHRWYQCSYCASVSPIEWWGHCPVCLANGVAAVNPGATDYLRARKAFFRDPVIDVLEGKARPFNLSVEEHTAQLSYRDADEPNTTTEDFERRFRDILVAPTDTSIDVLSSTTTMEVGIDIGSLVAVGLRNVPPLRQNYQQRAGRTGRRGSVISTVVTYAQNSPHDNYYFENPQAIIAGEPTLPGIDIGNPKIVERHIRAQLIQSFFHFENPIPVGSDIFSVLGKTLDFYGGTNTFSLLAFEEWLKTAESAKSSFSVIKKWVPDSFTKTPARVADEFLQSLKHIRPANADELEASELSLIEFLFSRGFLPSYAFPRDLCALQIEGPPERSRGFTKVNIIQRPQQGLNIALSEYAPGRFVVVNKKTYRVGTVAASGSSAIENRAVRLFSDSERRYYVYCPECEFTPGFRRSEPAGEGCPLCGEPALKARKVIVPQVVFPAKGREVDEHDDEQVFTNSTSAQLSVPDDSSFNWKQFGRNGQLAFERDQQLVMVNKGEEENGQHDGFRVCNQCGRTAVDDNDVGAHTRDYHISGRTPSTQCQGQYERVYLGYSFNSDSLLLRIPLGVGLRFDPVARTERAPISDAFQSLAEAIVLGIGRELDIDMREINAGFRFLRAGNKNFADIFIYDTLSGGAGYATQAGEVMDNVIEKVENLLTDCNCSSSCNKCLRHYGNRFHHSTLDRMLALDMLRYIRDGELPSKPSIEEQRSTLRPVIEMLQLAGWQIAYTNSVPVTATNGSGNTVGLFSYPSLVRPEHYGFVETRDKVALSPYELSRDLPGVYGRIA